MKTYAAVNLLVTVQVPQDLLGLNVKCLLRCCKLHGQHEFQWSVKWISAVRKKSVMGNNHAEKMFGFNKMQAKELHVKGMQHEKFWLLGKASWK